jgi:uncharacterized membrane protein
MQNRRYDWTQEQNYVSHPEAGATLSNKETAGYCTAALGSVDLGYDVGPIPLEGTGFIEGAVTTYLPQVAETFSTIAPVIGTVLASIVGLTLLSKILRR